MLRKIGILALCLLMLCLPVLAESFSFDRIAGQEFEFSSGVGAWSTELVFAEDGSFTGEFHDSDMGDTGENYPNGTVYECVFHGKMSIIGPEDAYTWQLSLDELEINEGQSEQYIEEGILYIPSDPYGLTGTTMLQLFVLGTPVSRLPEGFLVWSHLSELGKDYEAIPYYAIYNAEEECGFVGDFSLDN